MKAAPFLRAIRKHNASVPENPIDHLLVHTGQHYDERMSKAFFSDLDLPEPDINLGIGSGTHAEQVGQTMIEFEKVLRKVKPDWVVVVGDVNATMACSVTAKKEWTRCCHIEAGLRSGDMTMPEEVNRLVTDSISDLLLTADEISTENLRKEGCPDNRVSFVGNIMIDTLDACRSDAAGRSVAAIVRGNTRDGEAMEKPVPADGRYALLTLHRPSNVDDIKLLGPIVSLINEQLSNRLPFIWPIHPRARKQLAVSGLLEKIADNPSISILEPVGYSDMLRLNMGARIALTDSGGLQEECTVLGIPCLTMRWNTERPVTLREHGGTCMLVGNSTENILKGFNDCLDLPHIPSRPPLWDGHTAGRCLEAILTFRG